MMDDLSLVEMARTRRALAVERLTVLRVAPLQDEEFDAADESRIPAPRRLPPAAISPFTGQGCRKLLEPHRDPRAVFRNGGDESPRATQAAAIVVAPIDLTVQEQAGNEAGLLEASAAFGASPARANPRNRQADMANLLLQQVR